MLSKVKKMFTATTRASLARGYLQYRKARNKIILSHFSTQVNLNSGESPPDRLTGLRAEFEILKKHIDRNYCILDLPEYGNIGDHMIYEGTLEFLKTLPSQLTYTASLENFNQSKVNSHDIILLQGGGNLGDLWHLHQHFRERIISSFPSNRIIILPQTIFFRKPENLKRAVAIFSAHPHLTICVRDHRSYRIARENFTDNTVLLLPDMASYIRCGLVKPKPQQIQDVLFLQRRDKELKSTFQPSGIRNLKIKDWPTLDHNYFGYLQSKYKEHRFYLNEGIVFMANFDLVISTRLHGGIMGCLLGIPTILMDNSYGKNRSYCKTWLNDFPNFYFAETPHQVRELIEQHFPEVLE